MSEEAEVDGGRRRLVAATAALGGAGAAVAALPFLASLGPSARAEAAAAPVEVDVGDLAPGQMLTVSWRGKPVWPTGCSTIRKNCRAGRCNGRR